VESRPFTGVYSVTTTQRRRFFWCAWWTREPTREPFCMPNAWSGGARTVEEAKRAAECAAGHPLREIPPIWARAWIRVQAGAPPWVSPKERAPRPEEPPPREEARSRRRREPPFEALYAGACPFAVLGLPKGASLAELKRAFRRLSLTTHPDQGGTEAAFIRVKRAFDAAIARSGGRS
jgi:hypothetical protein